MTKESAKIASMLLRKNTRFCRICLLLWAVCGRAELHLAGAEGNSPQLLEQGPSIVAPGPRSQEELGLLRSCLVQTHYVKSRNQSPCPAQVTQQIGGRTGTVSPVLLLMTLPQPRIGQAPLTQSVKGGHHANVHPVVQVWGCQSELEGPRHVLLEKLKAQARHRVLP